MDQNRVRGSRFRVEFSLPYMPLLYCERGRDMISTISDYPALSAAFHLSNEASPHAICIRTMPLNRSSTVTHFGAPSLCLQTVSRDPAFYEPSFYGFFKPPTVPCYTLWSQRSFPLSLPLLLRPQRQNLQDYTSSINGRYILIFLSLAGEFGNSTSAIILTRLEEP